MLKLRLHHNDLAGGKPGSFAECYALGTLGSEHSGLAGALPAGLAPRARVEADRADDQFPLVVQMCAHERRAFMAADWIDNSVDPLLAELGVMEPRFPVDEQWKDRWPPAATRASPPTVYVDVIRLPCVQHCHDHSRRRRARSCWFLLL